jgi:hypothetical protein
VKILVRMSPYTNEHEPGDGGEEVTGQIALPVQQDCRVQRKLLQVKISTENTLAYTGS